MAFVLSSLNEDSCPTLSVCGFAGDEDEMEEQQLVSSPEERKEWRNAWRCKTCLDIDCKKTGTKNINLKLPVLQQSSDASVVWQAKQLTETIEHIQSPKQSRIKRLKEQQRNEKGQGEMLEITSFPFEACPWEWKYNPLCMELLSVHNQIKKNPGLFAPERLSKPVWDGYILFTRYMDSTEAYWSRQRIQKRKEEALMRQGQR